MVPFMLPLIAGLSLAAVAAKRVLRAPKRKAVATKRVQQAPTILTPTQTNSSAWTPIAQQVTAPLSSANIIGAVANAAQQGGQVPAGAVDRFRVDVNGGWYVVYRPSPNAKWMAQGYQEGSPRGAAPFYMGQWSYPSDWNQAQVSTALRAKGMKLNIGSFATPQPTATILTPSQTNGTQWAAINPEATMGLAVVSDAFTVPVSGSGFWKVYRPTPGGPWIALRYRLGDRQVGGVRATGERRDFRASENQSSIHLQLVTDGLSHGSK